MPGPDQDLDDGGMGIEPIMEPTIQLVDTGRVEAALQAQQSGVGGQNLGQQHHTQLVQSAQQVARTSLAPGSPPQLQQAPRGNAAHATGFDSAPATTPTSAQAATFTSPLARAIGSYSMR